MSEHSSAPAQQDDERSLVISFKAGEDGAYQAIYDRYSKRVGMLCRRMLLNPEDAAEACQETFLRVYLALPRFNGRYQLGAWVSRIATNVCLDMLRARGRAPSPSLTPEDFESLQLEEPDESRNPERSFLRNAEGHQVRDTLASLSPLHRAAIVLREFEGFSYAEIAGILEMTEHQVKALLHRARGSFRRSWMSAITSVFFPTRLWHKLRGVAPPAKGQAIHTPAAHGQLGDLVASSANFVTSCSATLQQCGQFMSERVAPLFVATAVGVAGGVAVASRPQAGADKPPATEVRLENAVMGNRLKADPAPKRATREVRSEEKSAPPVAEPQTTPAPLQSPPAEEEPTEGTQTSKNHKPAPNETAGPEQPGLPSAAIGFDRNGPVTFRTASSNDLALDCSDHSLSQSMAIDIGDGSEAYPGRVGLVVSGGNVQLEVVVTKEGRDYEYRSWGPQPALSWVDGEGSATIHFEGEYGAVAGPAPSGAGLPSSGPFSGDLRLDCDTGAVVSETIILGGN